MSELIQTLMDAAGENPFSLSRKIGVPQPTLHRLLSGQTKEPKRGTLERIAKFFHTTPEYLIKGDEEAMTGEPPPSLPKDVADVLDNYTTLKRLDPASAARWAAEVRLVAARLDLERLKSKDLPPK